MNILLHVFLYTPKGGLRGDFPPHLYTYHNTCFVNRMVDLNKLLKCKGGRSATIVKRGDARIKIVFQPTQIVSTILGAIKHESTDTIVGCVAWLSHPRILEALAKKPCAIVVTRDKSNLKKNVRNMYKKLRPCVVGDKVAVRFLGQSRGPYRTRMHHKFMVGLKNGEPRWVITGSFNFSSHACKNLENTMLIQDPEIAAAFKYEWERIWNAIT